MPDIVHAPEAQSVGAANSHSRGLIHAIAGGVCFVVAMIGLGNLHGGALGAGGIGRPVMVVAEQPKAGLLKQTYREVRDFALWARRIPLLRPSAEVIIATLQEVAHIVRDLRDAAKLTREVQRVGRQLDAVERHLAERRASGHDLVEARNGLGRATGDNLKLSAKDD